MRGGLVGAALALLAAAGCTPPPPQPVSSAPALAAANSRSAAPAIEYLDLTDDFAAFWEASKGMSRNSRAAAFKAHFEPLIPAFYEREKAGPFPYGDLILKALDEFPAKRAGIEQVSSSFSAMALPARASFEAELGPMGTLPPIILLHSLGEFDGGVRTLKATGRTLLFGADMIASIHSAHSVQPFFHHELFHVFHKRSFEVCDALWCGLWSEGLAVYAADRLNPGATDAQLLLVNPEPLRAAIEANRHEALCLVLDRLDSTSGSDNSALFSSGRISDSLPPRSGYYIGYLIAAQAGKSIALKDLAALPPSQVRSLIEANLRVLAGATCEQGEFAANQRRSAVSPSDWSVAWQQFEQSRTSTRPLPQTTAKRWQCCLAIPTGWKPAAGLMAAPTKALAKSPRMFSGRLAAMCATSQPGPTNCLRSATTGSLHLASIAAPPMREH